MVKSIETRLEALEMRKSEERRGRAILVGEPAMEAAGGAEAYFASIYGEPPGLNDKVICLVAAEFPSGHPREANVGAGFVAGGHLPVYHFNAGSRLSSVA